jgi:polar amino acid transport system substrate-binding protein
MLMSRRTAMTGLSLGPWTSIAKSRARLTLLTGDVPPLCDAAAGLLNAPVAALAKALGHRGPIPHLPWARALMTARSQGQSIIYPLGRSPDREPDWQWLQPLAMDELVLLVRRDALPVHGQLPVFHSLPRLRVGALRGALFTAVLQAEGQHDVVHARDERSHARLLKAGRLQAWAANRSVMAHLVREEGLNLAELHPPMVRFEVPLYLAATPDCSEADLAPWRHTPLQFTNRLW